MECSIQDAFAPMSALGAKSNRSRTSIYASAQKREEVKMRESRLKISSPLFLAIFFVVTALIDCGCACGGFGSRLLTTDIVPAPPPELKSSPMSPPPTHTPTTTRAPISTPTLQSDQQSSRPLETCVDVVMPEQWHSTKVRWAENITGLSEDCL